MKRFLMIIVPIILVVIVLVGVHMYFNNVHNFNLYVFNAGKADSALLTYKDKTIIIDCGEKEFFNTLDKKLKKSNIETIDYLIITHFDKDHVGGAAKLISRYKIGNIYQTNTTKESEEYTNFVQAINKKNITPITVKGDMNIDIDDLHIVINGPDKIYGVDESNNSSLITSIKYKNKSYLFMGDALNERMKDYISTHDGKYNIIKFPHHGDYMKQDEKLIEKYNPKGVIVSSNYIDDKLKELIDSKKLTLYYTNDADAYKFEEA